MELVEFTSGLLETGEVTVPAVLVEISADDLAETGRLLERFYLEDSLELAGTAPSLNIEASIRAAQYVFYAAHLIINRDAGEEEVRKRLVTPDATQTPSAMYSVDLVFRHLPALLNLAKGLAPSDILVTLIRDELKSWPLSAVGAGIAGDTNDTLLQHGSLRTLYTDRIIFYKEKTMASGPVLEQIKAVTGEYPGKFWPGFDNE
ncbi:MAG: hypothetical protein EOO09_16575 [Chitinophagaceae bacterium]|nr:MAG: hypothetical protein EOO09_16575 [Chitinophagaceae bacterium]